MRKNSAEIADVIRERICLAASADEMLLHEGQLATEFGVSRTPIRQVLQMLAYENLVETRSGIGTIATPLSAQSLASDAGAFRALLTAAAHCRADLPYIPERARLRLAEARRAIASPDSAEERLFRGLAAVLEATVVLVGDHIVATALRSAYWRHIRWCMARDATARAAALDRLAVLVSDSSAVAQQRDLTALVRILTEEPI